MAWLFFALVLIGSYFIGSVNCAILVSKIISKKDVRESGSGNAGMTNVMRTMGLVPGIITFLADVAKSAAYCAFAKFIVFPYIYGALGLGFLKPQYGVYYVAIIYLLGNVFPLFFGFKGGKGVSSSLGFGLICQWQTALIGFAVFIIAFLLKRIISLSSVAAAISLPILNLIFAGDTKQEKIVMFIFMCIISATILQTHKENIVRLIKGEEKKLVVKGIKEKK